MWPKDLQHIFIDCLSLVFYIPSYKLFTQLYYDRYLYVAYTDHNIFPAQRNFFFRFGFTPTWLINIIIHSYGFYFHDNRSFTHLIIPIEQYKVGWLTCNICYIPRIVLKEKNESSIDKTVDVCIVYVRSAFQKSAGCKRS